MTEAIRRPLIVGSGIAGLYIAVRCREAGLRPTVVTKARLEESNTRYAQGGIAAAIGPGDSPARHFADTVRAGAGLVHRAAAEVLTREAPARIADLVRFGVPFDTVDGKIALGREAAHSRARILHAGGDATGLSIEETLRRRAVDMGIDARERTVLRALRSGGADGPVAVLSGAEGGAAEVLDAGPVVLATGGAGSLYRWTTNPAVTTGEGIAIAYRAGALLADMEFVQFHPTAFAREGAPRYLITEAVRGEGAILRNADGERFMVGVHRDAELAPRDVVARAIDREIVRSGHPAVFLDATSIPRDRLLTRFPSVCRFLMSQGLDASKDPIPVAPVAHYLIGGVSTDLDGRCSLPGLYAAGEVAATGVHGANRLGSNSLLEGVVFGERVVRQLIRPTPGGPPRPERLEEAALGRGSDVGPARITIEEVRRRTWEDVGIVRNAADLKDALQEFEGQGAVLEPSGKEELASPLANAVLTARLIARAALVRTESRGAHYRSDWPRPRPAWLRHLGLRRKDISPRKR